MITNADLISRMKIHLERVRVAQAAFRLIKRGTFDPRHGIVACNVRNEIHLLPHFLKHYRSLGVRKFVFVDNGSEDDSKAYLAGQDDCDVYECLADFKANFAGMSWKNLVLTMYGSAKWYFSADADEHVVYDGWNNISLDEFASTATDLGYSAITALMVDMYSEVPLKRAPKPVESKNLLEDFPWFDGEGYEVIFPSSWRNSNFPRPATNGGPVERILGKNGLGWLVKTPLILEPNIFYIDPHTVMPVGLNFTPPKMVLLHFRFTGSLIDKILKVPQIGFSKGNSDSYMSLGDAIKADPNFSFMYEGSTKLGNFRQFIAKRMIMPITKRSN